MIHQFRRFAESHGLIMDRVEIGKIVRTKTTDHPKKRNGAYQFNGDHGWVQNHATMTAVAIWFPDKEQGSAPYDKARHEAIAKKVRADQMAARRKAIAKAGFILKACKLEQHAYLESKGFPDMRGLVWWRDENTNFLVIPLRVGKELTGLQLIDRFGDKTFLTGSKTGGASFVIGCGGINVFVEGYATGLSVHAALNSARINHTIHVCFSAGNMQSIAKDIGKGVVIADNDQSKTGERAAIATGLPFFMPPNVGEDFNDFHKEVGLLGASMALRKFYNGLAIQK